MPTWDERIEKERKEAEHFAMLADGSETLTFDRLASAQRQVVEACDQKVAALETLKQITTDCNLSTAWDRPHVIEKMKKLLTEIGMWPPK